MGPGRPGEKLCAHICVHIDEGVHIHNHCAMAGQTKVFIGGGSNEAECIGDSIRQTNEREDLVSILEGEISFEIDTPIMFRLVFSSLVVVSC